MGSIWLFIAQRKCLALPLCYDNLINLLLDSALYNISRGIQRCGCIGQEPYSLKAMGLEEKALGSLLQLHPDQTQPGLPR